MKSILLLLCGLAFAPDVLDTPPTVTDKQVEEKAYKHVTARGKKFSKMTQADAEKAFNKDLQAMKKELQTLLRQQTYNLNQLLSLGQTLGINKEANFEVLKDIYLSKDKKMSEILRENVKDLPEHQKALDEYMSLQHAMIKQIVNVVHKTKTTLLLLNDHMNISLAELDNRILTVVQDVYEKAIDSAALSKK